MKNCTFILVIILIVLACRYMSTAICKYCADQMVVMNRKGGVSRRVSGAPAAISA